MTFVKVVADHVDDHSAGAVFVHCMAGPDQVLAERSARSAEAVDPQSTLESICEMSVQGVGVWHHHCLNVRISNDCEERRFALMLIILIVYPADVVDPPVIEHV